jgi:hypothetical protein
MPMEEHIISALPYNSRDSFAIRLTRFKTLVEMSFLFKVSHESDRF